jgi:hypothetical protein
MRAYGRAQRASRARALAPAALALADYDIDADGFDACARARGQRLMISTAQLQPLARTSIRTDHEARRVHV